jgi:hypothetical protein
LLFGLSYIAGVGGVIVLIESVAILFCCKRFVR